MRKASKKEIEEVIHKGLVFHKARQEDDNDWKVRTKAKKKEHPCTALSAGVCVPPQAAMERHNAAVSDRLNAEWTMFLFFINRSPCCVRCGQTSAAPPDFFPSSQMRNPCRKAASVTGSSRK